VILTKYYAADKINGIKMGRIWGTYGVDEKCM